MLIEDGNGTGVRARVDQFNRLDVHNEVNQRLISRQSGKTWSMSFEDVDPVGAGDKFAYLTYTGADALVISTIRIYTTVAGRVRMEKVTGTPTYVGETALDITSRNLGSAIVPLGDYNSDTNITGLTDAGTILVFGTEAESYIEARVESEIFLTPGTAIALEWGAATGVLSGTLTAYETKLSDL